MCCIVLSSVAYLTLPYFSTISRKWHNFWKEFIEYKMCFDFLYKVCQNYFSLWEELSEILPQTYIGHHINYLLFLSDLNKTWILSTTFWKILKYQISWKSVQWEPGYAMHIMELIVTFYSILNVPKKETQITCTVQPLYIIHQNWIIKIRNCACYLISYVIFYKCIILTVNILLIYLSCLAPCMT